MKGHSVQGVVPGGPVEVAVHALIRRRLGMIVHDHQRDSLRARLQEACQHFSLPSVEAYLDTLERSEIHAPEMEFLIRGFTIGETYFFRDADQIAFLRDTWLPEKLSAKRARGDRQFRVWSAGCSSGEEIYTIAILLRELLVDVEEWKLHLLGSDINPDSLQRARRGIYRAWSLRSTTNDMRLRYFRPCDTGYELDESLRNMVQFRYLNLSDDPFPSLFSETQGMDLILCRNVFIYFARDTVTTVMTKFCRALDEGGMIMLAPSDSVAMQYEGLRLQHHAGISYFQRGSDGLPDVVVNYKACPPAPLDQGLATAVPQMTSPENLRSGTGMRSELDTAALHRKTPDVDLSAIIPLVREERWAEAAVMVELALQQQPEDSQLLALLAKTMANLGEPHRALKLCEQSLLHDGTNVHALFLRALVQLDLQYLEQAEATFRRILYLQWEHPESHFHLAMLMSRRGQKKAALKHLEDALMLCLNGDPERQLHESGGMTYGRFAQLLQQDISLLIGK